MVITDNRLVRKLVIETAAIVKPTLKDVWVRAQGVVATQKRECRQLLLHVFMGSAADI